MGDSMLAARASKSILYTDVAPYCKVYPKPGVARAVDDARVAGHEVVPCLCGVRCCDRQRKSKCFRAARTHTLCANSQKQYPNRFMMFSSTWLALG